ncbi:unnamed protein product [Ilex paraguariensis]|uniref:Uncharacterized protein n=1 Tax=Ilex paraguariensis TaxID=185542 RepID=A0ABC8S452_9AQUA
MSKLQSDAVREAISQIVGEAKEKNRNFTETIELQIGLKNYDPQKDKRFSGSVKLPHIPHPKMKVCLLGDAQHVEENYDPQKDKRFSGSVKLPHIPRPKMKVCMLGDAQHVEEESLESKVNETKATVKFQLKKFFVWVLLWETVAWKRNRYSRMFR